MQEVETDLTFIMITILLDAYNSNRFLVQVVGASWTSEVQGGGWTVGSFTNVSYGTLQTQIGNHANLPKTVTVRTDS